MDQHFPKLPQAQVVPPAPPFRQVVLPLDDMTLNPSDVLFPQQPAQMQQPSSQHLSGHRPSSIANHSLSNFSQSHSYDSIKMEDENYPVCISFFSSIHPRRIFIVPVNSPHTSPTITNIPSLLIPIPRHPQIWTPGHLTPRNALYIDETCFPSHMNSHLLSIIKVPSR
jgi:hypothetical protein